MTAHLSFAESRELVTSLIVRGDFEGWLEFNIHDGVRRWYGGKRNRTRNFGMVLEVEDKDGRTLNSPSIFTGSNCNSSKWPFPISLWRSDFEPTISYMYVSLVAIPGTTAPVLSRSAKWQQLIWRSGYRIWCPIVKWGPGPCIYRPFVFRFSIS